MLASQRNIYQNMVSKFELRDVANNSVDTQELSSVLQTPQISLKHLGNLITALAHSLQHWLRYIYINSSDSDYESHAMQMLVEPNIQ